MGTAVRPVVRAAFLAALALAGCSRGPATPAVPKDHNEAVKQVAELWALNRWQQVFSACDAIFRQADKAGLAGRAIWATECVGESSTRMGKPELAQPHYERVFSAYAANLQANGGRHRLANNYGVLLIERGKRDKGVAQLRQAMDAYAGTAYHIDRFGSASARAMIVRNLARAYYDRASEPGVRAWVEEQGAWYRDHMDRNRNAAHLAMGSAEALHALSVVGRRQANTNTPAWDAMVREWEPLEEEVARDNPGMAHACENLPLRDVMMEVCLREVRPAP